ncbi:hypothetical protein SAMN05421594_3910 [Chryseobacterium oleae]|uniref:Beta-lactamase-inhibitor-like, PepSY-like n=1 Tax=Chryseobacterium oleae TaxID=491207 RepID=A0A1I5BB19_CHROL|nr:hypothetical protein [Chryseobacterium oleae]SFN71731.1 hypothetical protein SAMN05421594_3910 [Chryseobacterium oleae]
MMVNWNIINSSGGTQSSQSVRKNIVSFLTRNYPCSVVDAIEKKYNAYKIYLMSGLCLTFDAEGRAVKTG